MKAFLRLAGVLLMLFYVGTPFTMAQSDAMVIHEVKLPTGQLIQIMDDGTWREKVVVKPKVEWVTIPAGTFLMGSPSGEADRLDDEKQFTVQVSAFKISSYEVTFEQFDMFCEATGRDKPDDNGWGRGNRPVVNVSWEDAVAFAEWVGARLPTEAEWEYACRAGTSTPFSTGENITTSQANYNGNNPYMGFPKGEYNRMTLPVGSFEPNPWGLYDMHGNVWEWCSDWYGPYAPNPQTDPKGNESGTSKVFRGGGWYSAAMMCRSARRYNLNPEFSYNFVGFRLVAID